MRKNKHRRILPGVLRFFGFWAGITGGYATMGSTCPCCGKPSCPVGLGIPALFGALGSFIINYGGRWVTSLFRRSK